MSVAAKYIRKETDGDRRNLTILSKVKARGETEEEKNNLVLSYSIEDLR